MFILSVLKDIVRVPPKDFVKDQQEAIVDELNQKYANKVLHNVGLCISVYDLLETSDPIVHACQDGAYQSRVKFRMVVFRPFKGEILEGRIKDCSPKTGVRVTMNFFDDIIIPPSFLMPDSEYDSQEGVWVWKYDGNDLFMDREEPIRFRVENEAFVDVGPVKEPKAASAGGPGAAGAVGGAGGGAPGSAAGGNVVTPVSGGMGGSDEPLREAPYTIVASIAESALGLLSWWEGQE
ncbi:RNA polymerase III subunit Rpc25-domain-containing protein [Entophlyctis helioformis]|nr:RNA polymerase III subunit Rpc25-domain-containing protein [Entophlyctis helioformis]